MHPFIHSLIHSLSNLPNHYYIVKVVRAKLSVLFHAASSAQAERQAVNTVCQGSAADLVKLAMIQLHQQLHQQFPGGTCRLLLQVTFFLHMQTAAPSDKSRQAYGHLHDWFWALND